MIYKLTEKGRKLLHMEDRIDIQIDIGELWEGNLVGGLSLRLVQGTLKDGSNYWLANGPLEIKALFELGLIQEMYPCSRNNCTENDVNYVRNGLYFCEEHFRNK